MLRFLHNHLDILLISRSSFSHTYDEIALGIDQHISRAEFEASLVVPDERAILNGERGEGGRRDIKENLTSSRNYYI